MQVAALGAEYVRREDVPAERVERERAIYAGQVEGQGKPAAIVEKIVEGKLEKFYAEVCLLEQPYIRDDKVKVGELVHGGRPQDGRERGPCGASPGSGSDRSDAGGRPLAARAAEALGRAARRRGRARHRRDR